jgi:hypothetical protein
MSEICGHSSVVERHLAKVNVARSNRVARLKKAKKRMKNPDRSFKIGDDREGDPPRNFQEYTR